MEAVQTIQWTAAAADRPSVATLFAVRCIAAALAGFSDHREEAEGAAGRLRELVVEDYDVDRNAARLLDCYRSAEDGARAAGVVRGSARW